MMETKSKAKLSPIPNEERSNIEKRICKFIRERKDEIQKLALETEREDKEKGYKLCMTEEREIVTGKVTTGKSSYIALLDCPKGNSIGNLHTHLLDAYPTVGDITEIIRNNETFICIVGCKNNAIRCFTIEETPKLKQLSKREKELQNKKKEEEKEENKKKWEKFETEKFY